MSIKISDISSSVLHSELIHAPYNIVNLYVPAYPWFANAVPHAFEGVNQYLS